MKRIGLKRSLAAVAVGAGLALAAAPGAAQTEKPQYGGKLEIGTVYVTCRRCRGIRPTGTGSRTTTPAQFYEQLFAADLSKAKRQRRQASVHADAWLPTDAIRGELAESWELEGEPAARRRSSCARA